MSLFFSFRPLVARLRARLSRGTSPLLDAADATRLVAPSATIWVPPATYPEGELEKVRGTLGHMSLSAELAGAQGGLSSSPEIRAFRLRQALLADGSVYAGDSYDVLRANGNRLAVLGSARQHDEAVLASNRFTTQYFGHWVFDTLALALQGERWGMPALSADAALSSHQIAYLAQTKLALHHVPLAQVDKLWVFNDAPSNEDKKRRIAEIRKRIGTTTKGQRRVILTRGAAGMVPRALLNEQQVLQRLCERYGFELLDPIQADFRHLTMTLREAELVLGLEGSALCHAVMCAPQTATVLAIIPSQRFLMSVKYYADLIGMRYAFVVADGPLRELRVDEPRLWGLIERLLSRRA